jgi:hypothetical protein
MRDGLTSHEIGQIDSVASFLGIFIGEKPTVCKLPSEYVGNEDDYSLFRFPFIWSGHIGRETMK